MSNKEETKISRSEQEKDTQFVPVFLTENIPVKVLNDFLELSIAGEEEREVEMAPAIINTKDVKAITSSIKPSLTKGIKSPFNG
jgi:hypothetical protein